MLAISKILAMSTAFSASIKGRHSNASWDWRSPCTSLDETSALAVVALHLRLHQHSGFIIVTDIDVGSCLDQDVSILPKHCITIPKPIVGIHAFAEHHERGVISLELA